MGLIVGVGMILVVREEAVETVLAKTDGYLIGTIAEGKREAVLL